ncbi:MAG: hypothetical protein ACRDVO_01880 [Jiangellaceae bacterium]
MELVGPVAVGLSVWPGSDEFSGRKLLPFAGRRCGKPGCGRTHGHIWFLATKILFRHPSSVRW